MALAQPDVVKDPLATYKEDDYIDFAVTDFYEVGREQYEKMARYTITAVQIQIYQQILAGKLVAYKDSACRKRMKIRDWEVMVLTRDTMVGKYNEGESTEKHEDKRTVIPFLPEEIAEWSYYLINSEKKGKKAARKKLDQREQGLDMDTNPWEGEVAIGFRPFRPRPDSSKCGNEVWEEAFFYIKAQDLKKLLSAWDQELIREFSMFHLQTSPKENQVYINPIIVRDWADSMELDAKRTIWNACQNEKVPVYSGGGFNNLVDVKSVVCRCWEYLKDFNPVEYEKAKLEKDTRVEDMVLHVYSFPATEQGPYSSIVITHIGFMMRCPASYDSPSYNTTVMHAKVDDVKKILTNRQIHLLMQALTFTYNAKY